MMVDLIDRILGRKRTETQKNPPQDVLLKINVGVARDISGRLVHGYISDEHGNPFFDYDSKRGWRIQKFVRHPFETDPVNARAVFEALATGAEKVALWLPVGSNYTKVRDFATKHIDPDNTITIARYMDYEIVPFCSER